MVKSFNIVSNIVNFTEKKIGHNPLNIHTLEGSRIVDEIDKEEAFVPFLKDLIIYIIVGIFRIIQR